MTAPGTAPGLKLPPIAAILDLHRELLAEHGGAPGLRDVGTLEAALARPHQLLAYSQIPISVSELAAAACISICRGHPFIDGNKRTAFVTLGVILGMNGMILDVSERDATQAVLDLASVQSDETAFIAWVAKNCFVDEDG